MKSLVSRFLAFVLLAVVFTVSTGMGFVEHTCLMENQKVVVFGQGKDCCSRKQDRGCPAPGAGTTVEKERCCADRTLYVHVDLEGLSQKVQHFFGTVTAMVIRSLLVFAPHASIDADAALHYGDASPPACGRDTLARKSTLQI